MRCILRYSAFLCQKGGDFVTEIKAIKDFYDRANDMKLRKKGEVFEAEPERAAFLEECGFVESAGKKTEKPKTKKTDKA